MYKSDFLGIKSDLKNVLLNLKIKDHNMVFILFLKRVPVDLK